MSISISATASTASFFAGLPTGLNFGADEGAPEFVGRPAGAQFTYKPELQFADQLGDDLGSWLNLSKEAQDALRRHALEGAREQAASPRYAGVRYEPKGVANITDESWALIHLFNNDFGWHSAEAKAIELNTGILYTLAGLIPHADKHYGPICGYDEDGKPCKSHLAARWWKQDSSAGKRVVSRVEMNPTSKPDNPEDAVFNTYHLRKLNMAVPDLTATRADIKIVDDHLLYECGGCVATREYILDLLAYMYRNPDKKVPVTVGFVSPHKGTGKTWLAHLLYYGLGRELFTFTGGEELWSPYDTVFMDTWVTWLDEMPDPRGMPKNVDATAKLKRLTTSHTTTLRPMYEKSRPCRVPAIFMTLNKVEAIGTFVEGDDARRYCFALCLEAPRSPEYYRALFAFSGDMEDVDKPGHGVTTFFGYLMNRDLSNFDPKSWPPQTGARALIREACLSPEAAFLKELIEESLPPFDKDLGRSTSLILQIGTTYGAVKGLRFTSRSLPSALRELGHKQLGVDGRLRTTDASRKAWCWRNFDKWDKKPAPAYSAHIDSGKPVDDLEDEQP